MRHDAGVGTHLGVFGFILNFGVSRNDWHRAGVGEGAVRSTESCALGETMNALREATAIAMMRMHIGFPIVIPGVGKEGVRRSGRPRKNLR